MTQPKPRNFNCPATGDACTDGRCTKIVCCEREKLRVEQTEQRITQERLAHREKLWRLEEEYSQKARESMRAFFKRFSKLRHTTE